MKNLFLGLVATIMFSVSGFANTSNNTNGSISNTTTEKVVISEPVLEIRFIRADCCEARFCWLEGTVRTCSAWVEVPCDKGIIAEGQECQQTS